MGEWPVTNVARVALSCTCLARIIHEDLLEKDINRGLVRFRSQCKFSFKMDFKFETLSLTPTRSSPWVRLVQSEHRRERRGGRHPLSLYLRVRTDWSAKLTRGLGKRPNRITPATAQANTKDKAGEVTRRGDATEEGFGSRIYITITTRM